jgi:hypothetical protein
MQWTSDELLASLQKRPSPNAYRKFMDDLRGSGSAWQTKALAPLMRLFASKGLATEEAAKVAAQTLMLPGDVYQGNVSMYGEDGRTNPQVINRSADLAGMMTLGSGAIPAEANSLRMGIKAYHGSPHDFDRFDMSKIGTGEGAQAYGHGLYFAENEGVARNYRDALSKQTSYDGRSVANQLPSDNPKSYAVHSVAGHVAEGKDAREAMVEEAARWRKSAQSYLDHAKANPQTAEIAMRRAKGFIEIADEIDRLDPAQFAKNPGRMYEVNIDANPDDFLDWDKPITQQPQNIRDALAQHVPTPGSNRYFDDLLLAAPSKRGGDEYTANVGRFVQSAQGEAGASLAKNLRERGIPGIKYLDAGSRNAGDGSRNYVVFDDKLISIVKKYGVAALVSAGVLSQAQGEEMKAQGYY